MAYDATRQAAALDIARNRHLTIVSLKSGLYAVQTTSGAIVGTSDYPDPVDALEAAGSLLSDGDTRAAQQNARRLISALSQGVYVPTPRPAGGGGGGIEWLVIRWSDKVAVSGPYAAFIAAALAIASLVNEPVIPPVNGA